MFNSVSVHSLFVLKSAHSRFLLKPLDGQVLVFEGAVFGIRVVHLAVVSTLGLSPPHRTIRCLHVRGFPPLHRMISRCLRVRGLPLWHSPKRQVPASACTAGSCKKQVPVLACAAGAYDQQVLASACAARPYQYQLPASACTAGPYDQQVPASACCRFCAPPASSA